MVPRAHRATQCIVKCLSTGDGSQGSQSYSVHPQVVDSGSLLEEGLSDYNTENQKVESATLLAR